MIVLAIDPGYDRLGIAVIEKIDRKDRGRHEVLLYSECFITDRKNDFSRRLFDIGQKAALIIQKYKPEIFAIEKLFFTKNQKTAFQVAETRGVLLYEAEKADLDIREVLPAEVKVAITGYGKSDKTAVTDMVKRLIEIKKPIKYDDEYDAIAIGLTALANNIQNNIRNGLK